MKKKLLFLSLTLAILLFVSSLSTCGNQTEETTLNETILIRVHVLTAPPQPEQLTPGGIPYELREETPVSVGVYEFYVQKSGAPGSARMKMIDVIPLEKITETEFFGEKLIRRIEGTLCVGYPTNFIDGKACVGIDQSQKEAEVTVHCWNPTVFL